VLLAAAGHDYDSRHIMLGIQGHISAMDVISHEAGKGHCPARDGNVEVVTFPAQ
jgi:hypothetical protein